LPYLSQYQIALLMDMDKIIFVLDEALIKPFAIQLADTNLKAYRFEK
jgi:hypothetical protein